MAIRVKCPNQACGKVLNVKDELAGKKGKCPGCGGLLPIPKAPAPVSKKEDDEEDNSPYALADKPDPKAAEEEAKKKARKRRDHDGDEDEEVDEDRPRKPERDTEKILLLASLGIGIVTLVGLGLAPLLNWYALTKEGADPNFNPASISAEPVPIKTGVGKVILGISGLAALCVCVGLVLSLTTDEDGPGEIALTITSCLAEVWGVTALIWLLGLTWWWIYKMRYHFEEMTKTYPAVKVSLSLDVGLIVALATSMVACLAFGYSLTKRDDLGWCYLSQFLGLIVGTLLVVLQAKPW